MNRTERISAGAVAATAVAVAVALVLAACTPDKRVTDASPRDVVAVAVANPCAASPPPTQVNINQVSVSGATATIKVNPGKAVVPEAGGSVHWKFNSNGYGLAANAVTFKPSQPAGPSASAGDSKDFYWCFGATAPSSTWNYNISFSADTAPTKIYDCDPTIINSTIGISTLAVQTVNCVLRP